MYDNDESQYNPQNSPPSQNKPSGSGPAEQGSGNRRDPEYRRDPMDRVNHQAGDRHPTNRQAADRHPANRTSSSEI